MTDIIEKLNLLDKGYVELHLSGIDFTEERWADFIGMEAANFRGGAIKFEGGYSAHDLVYEQKDEIAAKLNGVQFEDVELRIPITYIPASFVDGGLSSGEEVFLDIDNAEIILEPEIFAYAELGLAVDEIARLRKIEAAAADYIMERRDSTEAELIAALLADGGPFSKVSGVIPSLVTTMVDPEIMKVMLEEGQ